MRTYIHGKGHEKYFCVAQKCWMPLDNFHTFKIYKMLLLKNGEQ